jgi:hypothetical protein
VSWRYYLLGDLSGLRSGRITGRFRPGHAKLEPVTTPVADAATKAVPQKGGAGAAGGGRTPPKSIPRGGGVPLKLPLAPPGGGAAPPRSGSPAGVKATARPTPPRPLAPRQPGGLLQGLLGDCRAELGDGADLAPNGAVWVSGTTGQLYASTDAASLPLVYPDGTAAVAQIFLPAIALDVNPIVDKPLRASARDFANRDYDKSINPGGNRSWNPDLGAYGWVNDGGWHYIIDQACDPGGTAQPIERTFPGLDLGRAIAVDTIAGRCKDIKNGFNGVPLKRYIFKADFDWTNQDPNAAAYIWLYLNLPEFTSTSWIYQPADLSRFDTRPPETAGTPTKLPAAAWLDLNFLDAVYKGAHGLDLLSPAGVIDPSKRAKFTASYPQTWALAIDSRNDAILATVYERGQKAGYVHEQPQTPTPQDQPPLPTGDGGGSGAAPIFRFFPGGGGDSGAPASSGGDSSLPAAPTDAIPYDQVATGQGPAMAPASSSDSDALYALLQQEQLMLEQLLQAQVGQQAYAPAAPVSDELEPWAVDDEGNVYLLADDGQYYPSEMFGEDAWAGLSGDQ